MNLQLNGRDTHPVYTRPQQLYLWFRLDKVHMYFLDHRMFVRADIRYTAHQTLMSTRRDTEYTYHL